MDRSTAILDYVRSSLGTLNPDATHVRISLKTGKSWSTWCRGPVDELLELPALPDLGAHEKVGVRLQGYSDPTCTTEVDSAQRTFPREVEVVREETLRIIAPAGAEVARFERRALAGELAAFLRACRGPRQARHG